MTEFWRLVGIVAVAAFLAPAAQAEVVIGSTRVIYPEREHEVTLKLSNLAASEARLVEIWIDNGEADAAPEQMDVPFLLTPPIFRLDAGQSQAVRIVHAGEEGQALPRDRETVFWLNLLAVAPKTGETPESNTLRFAYRTRIKLFFRPESLAGTAGQAGAALQWQLLPNGTGYLLAVRNPSAYHVSFASIAVLLDGKEVERGKLPMLPPGGSAQLPLRMAPAHPPAGAEVRFETIGDDGGADAHSAPL